MLRIIHLLMETTARVGRDCKYSNAGEIWSECLMCFRKSCGDAWQSVVSFQRRSCAGALVQESGHPRCYAAGWSLHTPVMQPVAPLDSVLVAFSPSLDYLAVATQDGRLRAFETSEHYASDGDTC